MTEDEVTNGITIEQFRKTLKKRDDGVWTIDDRPLSHITDKEPGDNDSSSELTDYSIDSDDNSSDAASDSDPSHSAMPDHELLPGPLPASSAWSTNSNATLAISPDNLAPRSNTDTPKRLRDFPLDVDEIERATKRNRIEDVLENTTSWVLPPRPSHVYPLSRTLAAMARNPVWAHTQSATASGSGSTSQFHPEPTPTSPSGVHIDLTTSTAPASAAPSPELLFDAPSSSLVGPQGPLDDGDQVAPEIGSSLPDFPYDSLRASRQNRPQFSKVCIPAFSSRMTAELTSIAWCNLGLTSPHRRRHLIKFSVNGPAYGFVELNICQAVACGCAEDQAAGRSRGVWQRKCHCQRINTTQIAHVHPDHANRADAVTTKLLTRWRAMGAARSVAVVGQLTDRNTGAS